MFTVYVYALDTMADWEIGYVTAELNSGRFFKKDAPGVTVKTAGISRSPVKTMGGLTIIPDCVVDDIAVSEKSCATTRFKTMKEDDAFIAAPKWLDRDKNTLTGKVIALPARDDIDFEIAENLIVELYSK